MAMYECANCGSEEATLPKVFLAVNTTDMEFPYHNTEFEQKFNELWTSTGVERYDPKGWEKFWSWLGDNKIKWFCCIECAENYLMDERMKDVNQTMLRKTIGSG